MARTIVLTHDGKTSTFAFSRVSRDQLYATRSRMALDADGEPCRRAELSDDGSMLIVSGMTGQGYFADDGSWVRNDQLVGLHPNGEPAKLRPSTMNVAQPLEEVPPEVLLDLAVASVQALEPTDLDPELGAALQEGKLFRFDYNTQADYNMETGILLANEHGPFAIIGNPRQISWCELDRPAVDTDDADDEESDADFDFEML